MSKANGKAHTEEQATRNAEPELPPADPTDGFEEKTGNDSQAAVADQRQAVSELDKLGAERDNLLDRLARLQAEFDNSRKRAARENTEFRDYAVADAVRLLLPVLDNFSLALKNADANPQEFRKGVELIYKQLQEALQKIGVERVAAQGQPFDPRFHEAIEVVDSNAVEDHHVLEELQPGYKIKDRLLRPAMVRVARNNKAAS
jgi:molecular chaperone GrpE